MSLNKYLKAGGIKILKEEIKYQALIQLTTIPRQILNPKRLADEKKTKKRNIVKIIFTIYKEEDIQLLIRKGFRFGRFQRKIEYFQTTEPTRICFTYSGFGHKKPGTCGKRFPKHIIYIEDYSTDDHKYKVITYKT